MTTDKLLGKDLQHWLQPGDILPDEAWALLASAEVRAVLHDHPAWKGKMPPFNGLEVKINGEWREVCRTDLLDDVGTLICFNVERTAEEMRAEYLEHISYGARLRDTGAFACIDSLTDG